MPRYRISEAAKTVEMTADTLRYYERRGLLPPVARDVGGVRIYEDKDISRLRFIRRAQRMNFTLDEIGHLLQMREDPQHVRNDVRELTQRKLLEIEHNLEDLTVLRNELQLLVNLCRAAEDGCPILEKIEER
jgi:DNA-binding transcriptional MerR regulator